jgi:two-component sensor histidine kinase
MKMKRRVLEQLPLLQERRGLAYATALALSALAWWIRWELDPAFPPGFPYLTFFPAVIVTSFLFGRGPGTLSAIVCGVLAWYFFIPPVHTFDFTGRTLVALGFYAGVVAVDIGLIHAMQRANQRSSRLAADQRRLAERTELLFSELQHRVSNNIQMVGAMLSLQQRQVADPMARLVLADASTKLQLIGRIQRQLYSTSGEQVPLDVFLRDLMADLFAAESKPGIVHRIDAEPGILLAPDAAIPLALIMAEGIANAMEHGFANQETGMIVVSLARRNGATELCVFDDGAGLPANFDLQHSESLGLKVVRSLAGQMGAQLSIGKRSPSGTALRLVLPDSTPQHQHSHTDT